ARRANVDGVSFHVTRHTAVSRMVAAAIPDRIIMKVVGHTTTAMVSRYSHLAPDNLKGATDCLAGSGGTKQVLAAPVVAAARNPSEMPPGPGGLGRRAGFER